MMENKAKSPFDFIKSASNTKEYIFENESEYSSYIVNKGMSYFPDGLFPANEMNLNHNLSGEQNYNFYMTVLKKQDRFSKWHKPTKSTTIDNIMNYYECNYHIAKQYANSMSEEDINYINKKMSHK